MKNDPFYKENRKKKTVHSQWTWFGKLGLVVFILVFSLSHSQTVSAQNTKIALKLTDVSLKQVFVDIENQTGYSFIYNSKIIDVTKKISVDIQDKTISDVLDNIFQGSNIVYKIIEKQIVLADKTLENKPVTISGKVLDEAGEALLGATVQVEGTTNGVITDNEGKYTITATDPNSRLIITYVGCIPEKIEVSGRSAIDINLKWDTQKLDEIVVIGYGTIKKKDLTGAVSVISADDFKNVKALSVGEAIQGLASGVSVRGTGGIGSEPNIEVRGLGTFNNHSPLYVIDDLISTGGIRDLNVNDIESVQILKDASAAAIYGNRAANGVIIITTKKGKKGPMKVDFSLKLGMDKAPLFDLMDTAEYFKYNDMAYKNSNLALQKHFNANTDWQKETFRTGYTKDYNVGFSGGSDNGSYLVSLNYFNNVGTTIGTNLNRYSVRVNTEGKKGILTIGENLAISEVKVMLVPGNPYTDAARMTPDIPVYNADNPGGYGYGDATHSRTFGTNPVAIRNLDIQKQGNTRLRGNIFGELKPFKFLKYKLNLGYETSFDSWYELRKEGLATYNSSVVSSLYENRGRYQSKLIENTLSFDQTLGKNHIDAVLGYTYQAEDYNQISGRGNDIVNTSDNYYFDVLNEATSSLSTGGFRSDIYTISSLGRLNYEYDSKYLFSGTFRQDATSKFSSSHRNGFFPSASLGWRISKEPFFKVKWIDNLKIRANYGSLGNSSFENWGDNTGQYSYISTPTTFPLASFGSGSGQTETILNGVTKYHLSNSDLHWETKTQKNIGADIAFLKNRLQLSADYYISTTKDALYTMPILLATGNDGGNPIVNGASLENRGFEFEATWKDTKKDFTYSVSANLTTVNNKVTGLGYGQTVTTQSLTYTQVGKPLAMFYLIKTNGIIHNQEELDAYKSASGSTILQPDGLAAQLGDVRYVDKNADGKITESDRQECDSPWPKFEIGLNINAEYKNFDFSVQGFGSFGQKVYNSAKVLLTQFSDNSNYLRGVNPWTETNTNTNDPKIYYGNSKNVIGYSDRWLENGSFFKIRQITLGYTLKASDKLKYIDHFRISVTAQNYFTFTKYTGLDPEFVNGDILSKGVDPISYPSPKTLSAALSITF